MGEHLQTDTDTPGPTEAAFDDVSFDDLEAELEGDGTLRLEREQTIQRLTEKYGGQLFQYGSHSGTVSDIINLCPAASVVLEQGFDAMVGWIDGYKVDSVEEVAEEEKQEEEILQADNMSTQKQEGDTVKESPKEANKESVAAPDVVETESLQQSSTMDGGSSDISVSPEVKVVPPPPEKPVKIVKANQKPQEPIVAARKAVEAAYAPLSKEEKLQPDVSANVSSGIVAPSQEIAKPPVEKTEEAIVPVTEMISSLEGESLLDASDLPALEPAPVELRPPIEMPEEPILETDTIEQEEPDSLDVQKIFTEIEDNSETFVLPNVEDDPDPEETQFDAQLLTDDEQSSDSNPVLAVDIVDTQEADDELPAHTVTEILEQSFSDSEEAEENDSLEVPIVQSSDLESVSSEVEEADAEIEEILEDLTGELAIEVSTDDYIESEKQITRTIKSVQELQKATSAEECNEALADLQIAIRDLLISLGYDNPDEIVDRIIKQYDIATLHSILIHLQTLIRHNAAVKQSTTAQKNHHAIGYHVVRLLVDQLHRAPALSPSL